MALGLRTTKAFERDVRLASKQGRDIDKLEAIADLLQHGRQLPAKCRPHALKGNWTGHWDCHIEPDWILLYRITSEDLILVRTGTHAALFGR